MTQAQQKTSDLRLVIPVTSEELEGWMAEAQISHGDFYLIAAASRLGVLPDEVTIEQYTLMKVTCFAASCVDQFAPSPKLHGKLLS